MDGTTVYHTEDGLTTGFDIRGRPTPSLHASLSTISLSSAGVGSPTISRQPSKASIRSLFSRSRSSSLAHQSHESGGQRSQPTTAASKRSPRESIRAESPHLIPKGSRLDKYRPTQTTYATHIDRARKASRRRSSASWDPPPLFQAYPQSLRHTALAASCLPTEVILRRSLHSHATTSDESSKTVVGGQLQSTAKDKSQRSDLNRHTRKLSASINSSGWTQQLFVLVTSGYLLQYTGEGHYDRLPEKMLQLGTDTVAFASDAIPGRHWVLQVSQATHECESTVTEQSRGIKSRFGLQSSESKRTAQSMLLIFDNPNDFKTWLTAIRREIEALGGREYRPEMPPDADQQSNAKDLPSHQLWLQKDPHQFSRFYSLSSETLSRKSESDNLGSECGGHDAFDDFDMHSAPDSAAHQLTKNSSRIASTDLDRLRHSQDSSLTDDTASQTSYNDSNLSISPINESFAGAESANTRFIDLPSETHAQTTDTPVDDRSMCRSDGTVNQHEQSKSVAKADSARQHQQQYLSSDNSRRRSISTPNFSVPISSKRFSWNAAYSQNENEGSAEDTDAGFSASEKTVLTELDDVDEHQSARPVSIIAPLPTPEDLHPTKNMRRSSSRARQNSDGMAGTTSAINLPDSRHSQTWKDRPAPTSSLVCNSHEDILSAFPCPGKPLPALPRSTSANHSSNQMYLHPLRNGSKPHYTIPTTQMRRSATDHKSPGLALRATAAAPVSYSATIAVLASSNPRLAKLREQSAVLKLGLGLPAGPPPSCPLPATPSPSKRFFFSKPCAVAKLKN